MPVNHNDQEMIIQLLRIMRILNDAYILSDDEDLWQGLEDPLNEYQDRCKNYRVILKRIGDITTNQDLELIKKRHHDARIAMVENQMDLIALTLELNVFLNERIELNGGDAGADLADVDGEPVEDPGSEDVTP